VDTLHNTYLQMVDQTMYITWKSSYPEQSFCVRFSPGLDSIMNLDCICVLSCLCFSIAFLLCFLGQ